MTSALPMGGSRSARPEAAERPQPVQGPVETGPEAVWTARRDEVGHGVAAGRAAPRVAAKTVASTRPSPSTSGPPEFPGWTRPRKVTEPAAHRPAAVGVLRQRGRRGAHAGGPDPVGAVEREPEHGPRRAAGRRRGQAQRRGGQARDGQHREVVVRVEGDRRAS